MPRKVIFVIGVNASGKTYYINRTYGNEDVDLLNIYDFQQRAYDEAGFGEMIPFGAEFGCLMNANNALLDDIIRRLSSGRDVVVEHTLYKAKRRIAYIEKIREAVKGVYVEVYVMCPAPGQLKENLKARDMESSFERVKREQEAMEFPNPAEGFDRIYEVTGGVPRLRMDPPRPELIRKAREELKAESDRIFAEDEKRRKREELMESMKIRPFWHYCEVCGKKEFITAKEAFDSGWDYPPEMGRFGLLGPRTCGNCQLKDTLYWKVNTSGGLPIVLEGALTPEELVTWRRIKEEPESLLT